MMLEMLVVQPRSTDEGKTLSRVIAEALEMLAV
jgi:hypothetical protein